MEEKDEKQQPVRPTLTLPKYEAPVGDYDQWMNAYQQILTNQAQRIDPQRQAEQDAKIQRGRNFWTGANQFVNMIANAINASGTANGAPNMTWNNSAEQKMYEEWQKRDAELRADRRAAQQRYDELTLADAKWRTALEQQRAKDERDAYDKNYAAQTAAAQAEYQAELGEYNRQTQWQHDDEVRQQQQQFQATEAQKGRNFTAAQNRENREHQENMIEKRAQTSKGYNKGTKTIRIGNTDFKAETEAEADSNIAQVYGMVLAAYNKTQDNLHQQAFDGKPETEYSFINAHINQLLATDPDFKAQYEQFVRDHARSVATDNPSQSTNQGNSYTPSVR